MTLQESYKEDLNTNNHKQVDKIIIEVKHKLLLNLIFLLCFPSVRHCYTMKPYIVIKTANNHRNIVVSAENKKIRLFLSSYSLLYRCLKRYIDVVDVIEKRVVVLNKKELLNDLEKKQLEVKEQLCEACYALYEGYNWSQEWFHFGFDWTKRTVFDDITDENKDFLLSVINKGWHTQQTSDSFFDYLCDKVEGNITSQKQLAHIVNDILEGIYIFDDSDV